MTTRHWWCSLAALAGIALASPARADSTCTAVSKALDAGLAQPRIHAAIDSPPDAEALKAGFKPVLMHSIVIDQVQYSNVIRAGFSRTVLESKEMRMLASDLGPFMVGQGCRAAGSERIAGRDAQVYTASGDLGRGEVRFRLWIDRASGLPLRAISDEPDVDVDVEDVLRKLNKAKARPPADAKAKGGAKRVVATHAYLFGAAVKPPAGAGTLDAAALQQLQALLEGSP